MNYTSRSVKHKHYTLNLKIYDVYNIEHTRIDTMTDWWSWLRVDLYCLLYPFKIMAAGLNALDNRWVIKREFLFYHPDKDDGTLWCKIRGWEKVLSCSDTHTSWNSVAWGLLGIQQALFAAKQYWDLNSSWQLPLFVKLKIQWDLPDSFQSVGWVWCANVSKSL